MPIEAMVSLKTVQTILPVLALILAFVTMYFHANIIMELYNEQTRVRQKLLFALITGPVFSVLPMYLVYFLGGSVKLDPAIYLIFRNVNPIFALLYCFLCVRILNLSSFRSFRLMNLAFLILIAQKNFSMFIGAAFFGQIDSTQYDFYQDFVLQCLVLAFVVILYFIIICVIRHSRSVLKISDSFFTSYKKELAVYIIRSLFVYIICILLPLSMEEKSLAYCLIVLLTSLTIAICILMDFKRALEIEFDNMAAHISACGEAIEDFRGIKHDFYNILQTYEGYLKIGDLAALQKYHAQLVGMTSTAGNTLELSERVEENPAFFSLLMNKSAYAEKLNVRIHLTLPKQIPNLYIEMIDLCRALSCLLDNAIEAAAESAVREVQFTVTEKAGASVLIIISNNTKEAVETADILKSGISSKEGHTGIGLATVRKTLSKYGNCSFHLNYYDNEFNVYIALKPSHA